MNTPLKPVPRSRHPIVTKKYQIVTPPIVELCTIALDLIANATRGAVFWAHPGTGKSTGITMVEREIKEERPGTAVVVAEAWHYERPHQASFFEDLLVAGDHTFARNGRDAAKKKARVINFLLSLGLAAEDKQVVLIIDEAQNMSDQNLLWLAGIHNTLARSGVALMTLLVGQEELRNKRLHLVRARKRNLVTRFMVHITQFHGIRSKDELKEVLKTYDTEEYPADSGWSYSRFFADESFRKGWRIANWSSQIWEGFQAANEMVPENAPTELQMEYVVRTIERILQGVEGVDIRQKTAVRALIESSVALSGYLNELQLIAEVTSAGDKPRHKAA
jgi:hypothetical protein